MNRFCHICGTKDDGESRFCSNCGEQINEIFYGDNPQSSKLTSNSDDANCLCRGVLFTNVSSLSRKFSVDKDKINELIDGYVYSLERYGIHYTLIDASSYRYSNPSVSSADALVRLNSKDTWLEYAKILTDYYMFGFDTSQVKPKYLFIVGGDDIIPSPVIEHYYYRDVVERASEEVAPDKDIETDIPYSYLLCEKTFDLLNNKEIFKYEPYFHIGRLPFAADSNFDTIYSYFQRAIEVMESGGIKIGKAYAQSDITWRVVSSLVAEPLYAHNLLHDYSDVEDYECCNKIVTTPNIFVDDVERVFNCNANLFYFNMHGSDVPSNACFSGYLNNEGGRGFSPDQIVRANNLNIFVTEACYGAKNKSYKTKDSMLLSALNANTMIYLGSSRVAWGASDEWIIRSTDNGADYDILMSSLGSADLICGKFMEAICAGMPAGDALYFARKVYIQKKKLLSAIDAASLVEFNLFGDPVLLALDVNLDKKGNYSKDKIEPLVDKNVRLGCRTEVCYVASDNSILSKVRAMVDQNTMEIRNTINEYLYSNFSVEPRSLSYIIKNRYESGVEEYELYYSVENSHHKINYIATADTKGKIKTIYSTK